MTGQTLGQKLLQFAIISDTHVNPSDTKCNSPFPANAKANRRFRHVVRDLNQRDLSFAIHLGDLIHPVPSSGQPYQDAAYAYENIVDELNVPIHVIPGNHDIGDKPGAGGPVPAISENEIGIWKTTFGAQYGVVHIDELQILMLNAQLINSGLPDEIEQKDWAERVIADWHGRTMLMLHHPPFICSQDEPEHYDNLGEPGRTWVLDLIKSPRVVATFAGHAHNFWYDRIYDADYYRLPATSFVRQDFSEMLHSPPVIDTEYGRDDRAKLGYLIVEVYEFGHSVQVVRTHGAEAGPDDIPQIATPIARPPILNQSPIVGFDLRQNWAEITEIAPSGALDEFDRKLARNDYPLMGLLEMGVRDIRVPMSDLRDATRRERFSAMHNLGFRIALFFSGIPSSEDVKLIANTAKHISTLEIALPEMEIENRIGDLGEVNTATGLPFYLSPIRDATPSEKGVHKHVIDHGSAPDDEHLFGRLSNLRSVGCLGPVIRDYCDQIDGKLLADLQQRLIQFDLNASVHLRTGSTNPAAEHFQEETICDAVQLCSSLIQNLDRMRFYLDTLVTQDRGYFPRSGALDPQCNPTEIARLIANLHSQDS